VKPASSNNSLITKLEQINRSNREEIIALLDEENLNVLERTRILVDAGLISGEMIAGWIKEGSKKYNKLEENMKNDFITKNCERCDEEIRVPGEYPKNNDLLKWRPVICPSCSKQHIYDYDSLKWLR
jgi:hypothetical protein